MTKDDIAELRPPDNEQGLATIQCKDLRELCDAAARTEARRIAQLEAQVEAARSIISIGVNLMDTRQVGEWAGVREWLERETDTYAPVSTQNDEGLEADRAMTRALAIAACITACEAAAELYAANEGWDSGAVRAGVKAMRRLQAVLSPLVTHGPTCVNNVCPTPIDCANRRGCRAEQEKS